MNSMNNASRCFHKYGYQNWIFIILLFHLPTVPSIPQGNDTRIGRQLFGETINIGPCKWIINKKCTNSEVRFYLYTRKNTKDRQFLFIDDTWEKSNLSTSNFDPANPVKIIIHGYNADMFIHPLIQMKDEYFQRGEYNLIFVDWSPLTPAPCYPAAARNARHAGSCIGRLVERILDAGTDNIHLIGFSLGAQVTNFAANSLKKFQLPRITGLDPAMPLFITASNENKLDASDASFVDVIHTNALVQAKIERCGHADFYMNGGIIQPGCWQSEGNAIACSHHRAPDYFSESILSLKGFWGWSCSSYINYLLGLCPPTNLLYLAGEDCKPTTRGMFLVTTNGFAPFASGRWTDIPNVRKNIFGSSSADPFQTKIDQWGKLEGDFNNVHHYQDSNDVNEFNDVDQLSNTEMTKYLVRTNSKAPQKLEKNPEFVRRITESYDRRKLAQESTNLFEKYKRNLTNNIISDDIFNTPELN